jgi:hypothetical protein
MNDSRIRVVVIGGLALVFIATAYLLPKQPGTAK